MWKRHKSSGGLAWPSDTGSGQLPLPTACPASVRRVVLIVAMTWARASGREGRRHDRSESRTGGEELVAYNVWSSSMREVGLWRVSHTDAQHRLSETNDALQERARSRPGPPVPSEYPWISWPAESCSVAHSSFGTLASYAACWPRGG